MKTLSERFARKRLRLKKPGLIARLPFNKRDARKSMNLAYYVAQSRNLKDFGFLQDEKRRIGTPRWDYVTDTLTRFKNRGYLGSSVSGYILNKIYRKNAAMARGEIPFQKTSNILSLVARQEMLLLAYKRVKRNRGAMTAAEIADADTRSR